MMGGMPQQMQQQPGMMAVPQAMMMQQPQQQQQQQMNMYNMGYMQQPAQMAQVCSFSLSLSFSCSQIVCVVGVWHSL